MNTHHNHSVLPDVSTLFPANFFTEGGLLEINLAHNGIRELDLLMPEIGRRLTSSRWLVWLASPHRMNAERLRGYNIHPTQLLNIRPRRKGRHADLILRTIGIVQGNAIMAWSQTCNAHDLSHLQTAAHQAGIPCLIFTTSLLPSLDTIPHPCLRIDGSNHDLVITRHIPGRSPQSFSYAPSTAKTWRMTESAETLDTRPHGFQGGQEQPMQFSFL